MCWVWCGAGELDDLLKNSENLQEQVLRVVMTSLAT
jgi:hypothetical protein